MTKLPDNIIYLEKYLPDPEDDIIRILIYESGTYQLGAELYELERDDELVFCRKSKQLLSINGYQVSDFWN